MQELLRNIESYMDFLTGHHALSISLHFSGGIPVPSSNLLKYNLHCNNYCMFLKSNPELWSYCISRQWKIYDRAADGRFFGMCHAGVHEYVYPFFCGQKTAGFISISGYRCAVPPEAVLKHICAEYGFELGELKELYMKELKPELPGTELLDNLIYPLRYMLELLYEKCRTTDARSSLYDKMLRYIYLHHTEKITLDDLCREFYCSRSTAGRAFKAGCGMSVTEYITRLRMEDAKRLFENTSLSIAAVSSSLGFSDSNYFSNVFKRYFGISPLKYRRTR